MSDETFKDNVVEMSATVPQKKVVTMEFEGILKEIGMTGIMIWVRDEMKLWELERATRQNRNIKFTIEIQG
jgi:hypothetical protein